MKRKLLQFLFATLLLEPVCSFPLLAQTQDPTSFRLDGIGRVVAIADIHGAYDAFVSLLRGTALVDAELHWTGQDSHLVIVGDVLDRGGGSRQVLDLLMQLEQEAAAAGGAVHMVLGNHEIMNLSGELAYVTREEFAAYNDFEEAGMRRQAQSRFSEQASGLSGLALRSAFGRQYPRGFFGHRAAFAPDGRFGRWLLQKPVLLVINDTAFVHAGLSSRLLGSSLEAINNEASTALSQYLAAMQTLIEAEVLFPETDYHQHGKLAEKYLASGRSNSAPDTRRAAEVLLEVGANDPFNSDGPAWYRGMVDCSPALEQGRLQRVLETLDVEHLVIGHTPTRDHLVQERFDSSLIMADTGMLNTYFGGQPAAVIIENGALSVYYPENNSQSQPAPMPRLVGERPFNISDDELADMLATAEIIDQSAAEAGMSRLSLRSSRGELTAVFNPALMDGNSQPFIPEVAAYRLDRLLGMDMMPVAVLREIDGQAGAVYLQQGVLSGQTETSANPEAWCPAPDQQGLMQIFDFLLNKQDSAAAQARYMTGNGKLVVSVETNILDIGTPSALAADAGNILPFVRSRLTTLTPALLEEQLGNVLDASRRQALLDRRDLLLSSGDR